MKQLIINGLVNKYNKAANIVDNEYCVYSEPFSLYDEEACNQCPVFKKINCANQEIVQVNCGDVPVEVINIEEIIKSFSNNASSCDFLMTEENSLIRNQLVFCELTCSQEKYVDPYTNDKGKQIGKRAKAENQLKKSVISIMNLSDDCRNYIVEFPKRVCLFAWKDTLSNTEKNVKDNMQIFIKTPSSMAKTLTKHESILDCDFTFVEIRYPTIFNW